MKHPLLLSCLFVSLTASCGNAAPDAPTPPAFAEAAPLPVPITANDALVRTSGRWDWQDKAGPRCAWPASSVAVKFQGTDLNVQMKDTAANRWQVEVDGAPTTILQMQDGAHLYRAASGLVPGAHTVRLVKATESFCGVSQLLGLQLNPGGKLLPLPAPAHRLEVIGDSISAGYGNEAASKDEHFSATTENAYKTYGAIAARELGADYSCEAWSGKKMWPDNTIPELYDRILPQDPASKWDFSKWTPDVVLINLATNDFNGKNPDEAGWTSAYEAFIARLREHDPKATILCAIGTMMGDWGDAKPLTTLRGYLAKVVADRKVAGDEKVEVIDFGTQDGNNGFGADWHPNVKTHQIMAAQLAARLRQEWEVGPVR